MSENTDQPAEVLLQEEKRSLDPRFAFVLMVIMIVCALLIGANKAWKKNRSGVNEGFELWLESNEQRCETAYNLLTVADRYLPESNSLTAAVRTDLLAMEQSATMDQMKACVEAGSRFLKDAATLLTDLAGNQDVLQDARDSMYVKLMLPQAVEQCANTAALDAYNKAAAGYNDGMHSFSGLLARLTGIDFAPVVDTASENAG